MDDYQPLQIKEKDLNQHLTDSNNTHIHTYACMHTCTHTN